jgi:hypothetical protein
MTKTAKLTRTFARERGITGRNGGWLYRADGTVLCHGYLSLERMLLRRGDISPDSKWINWRLSDLRPI